MISIVILALFSFAFLGTEYIFDNTMAYFTTSGGVVMAQNYILGASVIGFVLYPFVRKWIDFTKKGCAYAVLAFVALCMYFLYAYPSYELLLLFGLICYVIFGMLGSHAYDLAARSWDRGIHIARNVGIAYALGVGIQFVNNNIVVNIPAQLVITVCAVASIVFLINRGERKLQGGFDTEHGGDLSGRVQLFIRTPEKAGVLLIVIVALMACLFSAQDTEMTLIHADGAYDIGQLPRILLSVSGLAAGVLFDAGKRKYMYLSMSCIALLSVIGIVVMQFGGPFLVGLIAFYLSGGFYVVFFSTSFIDLSYECRMPALWAGLGRAVNNVCAIAISAASVFLQQRQSGMVIMIVSMVLLAGITVCTYFFMTKMVNSVTEENSSIVLRSETADNTSGEKFLVFCNTYSFTERERDVMRALLQNDKKMQDIAAMLYLSRTALYNHIAKINEKTQTNNRISLLQFYHQWER